MVARLVAGGLPLADAFDMTPAQLVFLYEERERDRADQRLAFIGDLRAGIGALLSEEAGKAAAGHIKALERFSGGS